MTRDEIIRMAREAGCLGPGEGGDPNGLWEPNGWENVTELMFRFAALVAAAEREACAKLCDEIAIDMWKLYKGLPPYKGDEEGRASEFTQGRSISADDCAEAIRNRSST